MASSNYNITVESGETFSDVITWNDSNGNPINNTGYTANMDVRDNQENLIVNLNTTPISGGGSITLGGSNGQITLALSSTVTQGLTPGDYLYDLFMVSSGGSATRLVYGVFTLVARTSSNV